jgi:hypothetical protein
MVVTLVHEPDYLGCLGAMPDHLQPLLDAASISGYDVGPAELERLWPLTGNDDPQRLDEFLDAVAPAQGEDGLPLRVGQWTIDLREAGVRSAVMSAFIAAALIPQGIKEFGIGFATAIIPSVLEIKRVELGAGDELLLIELRSRLASGTEDELYAALPAETRDVVNRFDFADFVERLRDAGFAEGSDDRVLRLRAPDGRT